MPVAVGGGGPFESNFYEKIRALRFFFLLKCSLTDWAGWLAGLAQFFLSKTTATSRRMDLR